jgi:proteasome accessory factor B
LSYRDGESEGSGRAVRLIRIRDYLLRHPEGATTAELASQMGVNVRSVQRDILTLETDLGLPLIEENHRYKVSEDMELPALRLTLFEARAVFMAVRLYLKYADKGDASGLSALQKLAAVMPEPLMEHVRACYDLLSARPVEAAFARTIDEITRAWSKRQRLRIRYQSWNAAKAREYIVEPYFLEPSAQGFATYLIAYSLDHKQLRVFKVERIQKAEAIDHRFHPRDEFRGVGMLETSWGVVWSEHEQPPVRVLLRFSPAVARRVQESNWHPSQELTIDKSDGSALVRFVVPGLMELVPWLRGWGPEVEVLEPAELRDQFREEASRQLERYGGAPS